MQNTNNQSAWKLDKTVGIGHLLTSTIILASVFGWAFELSSRIQQNENAIALVQRVHTQTESKVAKFEKKIENLRIEIKTDLKVVDDKLDRIIEKQLSK